MPLVCEEPVTRQAYALGAKFYVMPTGESIRLERPLWIKTEPTRPKPQTSAMVRKRKKASAVRMGPSWRNIEAPTAAIYVGCSLSSGHSKFQLPMLDAQRTFDGAPFRVTRWPVATVRIRITIDR